MKQISTFTTIFFLVTIRFSSFSQIYSSSLTSSADAMVNSRAGLINYGIENNSDVRVISSSNYQRFLINFNVNSLNIPSNAIISSSTLELTPTSVGEGTTPAPTNSSFVLNAISNSWFESTVNFSNQPSVTTTNQVLSSSFDGVNIKRVFDVKNIVQNVVSGALSFNGFLIRRNDETIATDVCQYNTKESSITTSFPKLKITWYLPMSITGALINQASVLGLNDGSITPTIINGSGSLTYEWFGSNGALLSTNQNLIGASSGWYGLKVKGQLGDVFYIAFIVGTKCELITVSASLGPNYIDDATLRFSNASFLPGITNFGLDKNIQSGWATTSSVLSLRSNLTRFRLWFDPQNNFIESKLSLTGAVHSGTNNQSQFQRVTQDWDEMKVTSNTQPVASNDIGVILPNTINSFESKIVDLTNYFTYWQGNPNYGVKLIYTGSDQTQLQSYYSSDETVPEYWPLLNMKIDDATCDRTSFFKFKKGFDAGYAVTFKGTLKVQFVEEYQQPEGKKWILKLYDLNQMKIAAVSYDGNAVTDYNSLLTAIPYAFDDNRFSIALSTLGLIPNSFYILELTKSTGESEFVKFKYIN